MDMMGLVGDKPMVDNGIMVNLFVLVVVINGYGDVTGPGSAEP